MRERQKSPEHGSWYGMQRRKHLKGYVGLDVSVCDGLQIFDNFFDILGLKPTPAHSVDRIKNLQGYWCGRCPECKRLGRKLNIRWATKKEQARNTRRNHILTIGGVSKTVAEWTEQAGLPYLRIVDRLRKGWPVNDELLSPLRPLRRLITHDGVTLHLAEWARRLGVDYKFLHQRIHKDGMSFDQAITTPNKRQQQKDRRN